MNRLDQNNQIFMNFIDKFLNSITMYRLVLYGLLTLVSISIIFGFLNILSFGGFHLLGTALVLVSTCQLTNYIFAKLFKSGRNTESALITALILFFIIAPIFELSDIPSLLLLSTLAMLSKYIFAIHKKHLFNPAAAGSFLLILAGSGNSFWWIGSSVMLPFVSVIGLLIIRKTRRFALFFSFIICSLLAITIFGLLNKVAPLDILIQAFNSWPLIFFATFMLSEPLTTPPTNGLQIIYGALVGLLFGSQFKIGPIYSTPELALIIGNLFSYLVSPKEKLILKLKEKIQLSSNIYEFIFALNSKFNFKPGQYLEWTLPHLHPDNRGNRRYFTIASSPTENEIKLGVRVQKDQSSSFKKALVSMQKDDQIIASQLSGNFNLPKDPNKKIVFIAGGIGVTPFKSMIQYLLDLNQKLDIILFYASTNTEDFAYKNIFETAEKKLGIKTIYIINKSAQIPENWQGQVGYITKQMVEEFVPDYSDRIFYLSGPNTMVESYKTLLATLKIPKKNIVTDYFPGF